MELVREYGEAPYRFLVLHGGPEAPGCAAGKLMQGMIFLINFSKQYEL